MPSSEIPDCLNGRSKNKIFVHISNYKTSPFWYKTWFNSVADMMMHYTRSYKQAHTQRGMVSGLHHTIKLK